VVWGCLEVHVGGKLGHKYSVATDLLRAFGTVNRRLSSIRISNGRQFLSRVSDKKVDLKTLKMALFPLVLWLM
jgi:hypothetical protein